GETVVPPSLGSRHRDAEVADEADEVGTLKAQGVRGCGAVALMGLEGAGQEVALEALDGVMVAGAGFDADRLITSSLPVHSRQSCSYSQSLQSQQPRLGMNTPARTPLSTSLASANRRT